MLADEQVRTAASSQSATQPDTAVSSEEPKPEETKPEPPKVEAPEKSAGAVELEAIIERWVASVPVAFIQELEAFCKKHHAPLA